MCLWPWALGTSSASYNILPFFFFLLTGPTPSRDYQLEVRLGLAWGKPASPSGSSMSFFGSRSRSRTDLSELPQELHLPLHFSAIQVYSGLAPPPALVEAMRQGRGTTSRPSKQPQPQPQAQAQAQPPSQTPPALPPRPPPQQQQQQQQQPPEALYPPQLQPDQAQPPYDDAPPTYEEAMAEMMTGPMFPSAARPAYSGVTDENGPSTLPEKS